MIALAWSDDAGSADLVRSTGNLGTDAGLETAVLMSLFTDRDEEQAASADRGGWWGDAFAAVRGDRLGSRLHQLARAPVSQRARLAVEYSKEALQWLVDDGVAKTVVAEAELPRADALLLTISIAAADAPRWQRVWEVHLGV